MTKLKRNSNKARSRKNKTRARVLAYRERLYYGKKTNPVLIRQHSIEINSGSLSLDPGVKQLLEGFLTENAFLNTVKPILLKEGTEVLEDLNLGSKDL